MGKDQKEKGGVQSGASETREDLEKTGRNGNLTDNETKEGKMENGDSCGGSLEGKAKEGKRWKEKVETKKEVGSRRHLERGGPGGSIRGEKRNQKQ